MQKRRAAEAGLVLRAVGSLKLSLETGSNQNYYHAAADERIQKWVHVHTLIRSLRDVYEDIASAFNDPPVSDSQEACKTWTAHRHAALVALARAAARPSARSDDPDLFDELIPELGSDASYLFLELPAGSLEDAQNNATLALGCFGVADPRDQAIDEAQLNLVPDWVRIRSAEPFARFSHDNELAKVLVKNCVPNLDSGGNRQGIVTALYRLLRLRRLLRLPHVAPEDLLAGTGSTGEGFQILLAPIDELAELDASVVRAKRDSGYELGPVMSVARRSHRIFEIPFQQRRGWHDWYIAQATAPRLLEILVQVVAQASSRIR